jgi:DNA-directed RNA polymerase specialized sigma24 family protein
MRLVYERGLSYREAGEFLGLSARQVDNMLMKLRAGLLIEEGTK